MNICLETGGTHTGAKVDIMQKSKVSSASVIIGEYFMLCTINSILISVIRRYETYFRGI